MKKILSFVLILFCCQFAFSQASTDLHGFVAGGGSSDGITRSIGQTFTSLTPVGTPNSLIETGLQHAYAVDSYDTQLCYADDIPAGLVVGDNEISQTSIEGYDELLHRRVYAVTCPSNIDSTMASPGIPTSRINHAIDTIVENIVGSAIHDSISTEIGDQITDSILVAEKQVSKRFITTANQTTFTLDLATGYTQINSSTRLVQMYINGMFVGDSNDGTITITSGTTATYDKNQNDVGNSIWTTACKSYTG